MATFEYEALDTKGRAKRGVITAETAKLARQTLRQQALTPVMVRDARNQEKSTDGNTITLQTGQRKLSASDQLLLTRQLATLISTAVPLEEALNALAQQSEKPHVRSLILSVRERILEGWRLADALGENPKSFSPLYQAIVAAGEMSGNLGQVLERLALMLEKNRAIRNKAMTALIYPATLASVATLVVIGLLRYVVPKIVEQFEGFDAQLPWLTKLVIASSNFIRDYGVFLLIGVAGFGIMCWQIMRTPDLKEKVDGFLLRLPVVGKLMRSLEGARFGRTLATLFAGGAPLLDSLQGAQKTVGNLHMRARLDTTISMVREGAGLSVGLKRSGVMPPMMSHMVAAGERSGELPQLLDKTASHLEDEFEAATSIALRLLEPAIIVVMGVIVTMIVLSILLPTLQLNSLAAGA